MKHLVGLISGLAWLFGLVLAKGFWSTMFALIMPVWAWYLSIEWLAANYIFK